MPVLLWKHVHVAGIKVWFPGVIPGSQWLTMSLIAERRRDGIISRRNRFVNRILFTGCDRKASRQSFTMS
jgi:hypothetical protein